jgi:aspartate carbamoyltransferase catalytic subunit
MAVLYLLLGGAVVDSKNVPAVTHTRTEEKQDR